MAVIKYIKSANKQLSKNFRLAEFRCKCKRCKSVLVDDHLVEILQKIRDRFGVAVNINSGYRCREHNAEVNGDPQSSHMQGMAADIHVVGISPKEVAKYAESIGVKRIGLYDTFVHIGSGEKKLFWINHNSNQVDTFGGAPAETFAVTLPVLKRGMKNGSVWSLQALLLGFGYDLGTTGVNKDGVDGSFGPKVEIALKRYQFENDLAQTGCCDGDTWTSLLELEGG
jgi:hypothetical protein